MCKGKKNRIYIVLFTLLLVLSACSSKDNNAQETTNKAPQENQGTTLVYGSNDYTRINPAIDEHGEINALIFDGLTDHNAMNEVVPGLAKSWDYDEKNHTYTFHLLDNVKWHDGEPFTANDVKFTIEAIMNPDNESEIASNYEDVKNIEVQDDYTIAFTLEQPNVAFLEYMTIAVLPEHLLQGEDMQEAPFFKNPVGTGPYKMKHWDSGQSISLEKNADYYKGAPKIDNIVFKVTEDDNVQALQLKSGEIQLALISPTLARQFDDNNEFTVYKMTTADYRGILYNFNNPYWQDKRALIPAFNYAFDREAMLNTVLLGDGEVAYGPLQKNQYNDDSVEKYTYNPQKAKELIEAQGWKMGKNGFYEKNGETLSFELTTSENEQERIDLANIAAQQLKEIGVDCQVNITANIDWENQYANLIGWGSPFDADDHTYKVFSTGKGNNYSDYSNTDVDKYLSLARQTADETKRAEYYKAFQQALAKDPAYSFFVYLDAHYVADKKLTGIAPETVLGHHGVGLFWNIEEWEISK